MLQSEKKESECVRRTEGKIIKCAHGGEEKVGLGIDRVFQDADEILNKYLNIEIKSRLNNKKEIPIVESLFLLNERFNLRQNYIMFALTYSS